MQEILIGLSPHRLHDPLTIPNSLEGHVRGKNISLHALDVDERRQSAISELQRLTIITN